MRARTSRLEAAGKALVEALERIHERDRLRGRIDAARAALHVHMRTLAELHAMLRRDVADVESLERPGLRHFLASLTGGAARRVASARREMEEAKHRFDAAKALADADQAEIRELQTRIDAIGDVDHAAFLSYAAKEEALADASPRVREALRRVAAAIGDARARIAAVNAASDAARRARQSVRSAGAHARAALDSDSNLLAANSEIDDALAFARQSNARLARLSRELADVPELARTRPPTFAGGSWSVAAAVSKDAKRIDAWLTRLFGRIRDRRRSLQAAAEKLEARRDRWVLRA